jgi:hypothetical protein
MRLLPQQGGAELAALLAFVTFRHLIGESRMTQKGGAAKRGSANLIKPL